MGMNDAEILDARAQLHGEMIRELLARRERAQNRKRELMNAARELAQIDQTLVVIASELTEYGYVEPAPTTQGINEAAVAALAGR